MEALMPSMLNGSFSGFRSILDDAAQHTDRPATAALRDRLEKLSDQWDAALVCKIQPLFGVDSTVGRSAVQTYYERDGQLVPFNAVFVGTKAGCQRVVAGLEAGTITMRDVRQPNFELPSLPEQKSAEAALERLWSVFNNDHPANYQHPSMSVSDIIAIRLDGMLSFHYCDSYGFKQLPDFLQPENYLKNAEMSLEDDLGMIDGIINNEAPKPPSVRDNLRQCQEEAGKSHGGTIPHNRDPER